MSEVTDQLTEEEEKTKSLNKLKNKQEAVIADLEGKCPKVISTMQLTGGWCYLTFFKMVLQFKCCSLIVICRSNILQSA